jgi:hypothetical protein
MDAGRFERRVLVRKNRIQSQRSLRIRKQARAPASEKSTRTAQNPLAVTGFARPGAGAISGRRGLPRAVTAIVQMAICKSSLYNPQ